MPLCERSFVWLICLAALAGGARLRAGDDTPPIRLVDALERVGQRVERWYARAQTVVSREAVSIQPLRADYTPVDFPRRLVFELRVAWDPERGPLEAAVMRQVVSVNGRSPRANDRAGCMDPKPVSPETLTMLLPARRAESEFSLAGQGRVDRRPALMIDYRGLASLPPTIQWTTECVTVSLPGRSRGRIWIDAETYDVIRLDDRLVGSFEFDVPHEHVRRGAAPSMIVERAESSIRYKPVKFADPVETLMLPSSIDSVAVIRGAGIQRVRISQRFTDHRRFLTDGRLVD